VEEKSLSGEIGLLERRHTDSFACFMDMLHQAKPLPSALPPTVNGKKTQPNKENKSQEHQGDKSDLTACICSANNAACTEDDLSHDSDTNHEENSSHTTQ